MDNESGEVLDLTQMSDDHDLRLAASTNRPSGNGNEAASQGSARKVKPSDHNNGSGSPYRADLGNGTTKAKVARLQAVTPQKPAPFRSTPANASNRAVRSPGESSLQGFYRPRISQSVARMNSDSDTAQTSPATPSGIRKRSREDMLTPPSTQASRSIYWKASLDDRRRREASFQASVQGQGTIGEEESPLRKKYKYARIDDSGTDHRGLLADTRRLELLRIDLLDQAGEASVENPSPSNDTHATVEAPANSQPVTDGELSDSQPRLQLSPAQPSELWNKFTENPETGSLNFCDCEFHRSSNNDEQRRDRESGTKSPPKTNNDDDENLSIKTRKCQTCGGAKVKQDKRDRFARQWQEIFGRGTAGSQQIGVDSPQAAARPVDLAEGNLSGAVNDMGVASGDLGALSAEPTAAMDRLLAVNEQLRVATMELIRKQDAELRALSARQQAFESEMKEFRTGLETEVRELKLHVKTTFFSFAEQMSAAIEDQGRLADAAGGRRRTRVEDLPQNRMLETAQAFSRRLSDVEEVVEE